MQTQLGPMWQEVERGARSHPFRGGGRRLFLLLSFLSLLVFLALLGLIFFLLEPRLASLGGNIDRGISDAFKLVGVAAAGLTSAGFLSTYRNLRFLPRSVLHSWSVFFLLPVSEWIGGLLGMASDTVKAAFLDFNNAVVQVERHSRMSHHVLLLLPHCLQNAACTHMLGDDIRNCEECGACAMAEIKALLTKYSFETRIVGGGRLALEMVRVLRPEAVIGVACERELVAAIRQLRRVPVVAVSNWRPEGPCRNTRVVVEQIEQALGIFLKPCSSRCTMQ